MLGGSDAICMRGLLKNELAFYHNATPDAIKKRLPLIHDGVHFNQFPGIAGSITGHNYYLQRNRVNDKRLSDSLGLNNFLYCSLKFFFTKTPQLPDVK